MIGPLLLLNSITTCIGNQIPIYRPLEFTFIASNSTKQAHRVGVASTNRTNTFWHTGSYDSVGYSVYGIRAFAQVDGFSTFRIYRAVPVDNYVCFCHVAM